MTDGTVEPGRLPPDEVDVLRARMRGLMPGVQADLEDLVRIPSVSAPAFDQANVQASADAVERLLREAGVPHVDQVRAGGPNGPGAPAVIGHRAPADGAPTVLLYAHHDVQPPGDPQDWSSAPFEPVLRGGRLYGRGAADDKAGVMAHVAALRALLGEGGGSGSDPLRTGVTVFVEGEEEIGSPTFTPLLEQQRDRLAADVIVVADSANWRVGVPALTTSLRGLVDGTITVRTLRHGIHSGLYGGAVPDAMLATVRLLDSLWDTDGSLAVDGLVRTEAPALDYPEATLRTDAGMLDGVDLIGTGSLTSRLWTRPALTIIGIDAPSVATASNTLLAGVRVKFALRIAPGQDPHAALESLRRHLVSRAPFGAEVEVTPGECGQPFAARTSGPAYATALWALGAAWGSPPVETGMGGSIPFVSELVDMYPEATVLVTGVEDPDSRAHGPDESLHLAEFERACLAEALLVAALGR